MRLVSVDITNYRVIEALHLDLTPGLNLLTGPNESGKTTLVEAIGVALFVKPGGASGFIRGTQRAGCEAPPEVTVVFDHEDGQRYRVRKRFGKVGETQLTWEGASRGRGSRGGGRTWTGAEADDKLCELMGVDGALGGKQISEEGLSLRWGHLCVTQEGSTEDPLGDRVLDRKRRDELLEILGQSGQELSLDPIDRVIRDKAEKRFLESWSKGQTPRLNPNSRAKLAQRADEKARAELEEAERACEELAEAQRVLEESSTRLAELQEQRGEREKKIGELEGKIASGQKLESEKERLEGEKGRLEKRVEELVRRHDGVLGLEKELASAEAEGATAIARLQGFGAEVVQLKERLDSEALGRDQEKKKEQALEARGALLEAQKDLLGSEELLKEQEVLQAAIRETEAALLEVEESLAGSIAVDAEALAGLEERLREKEQAEARLEGMVTRVELLEADCRVELVGEGGVGEGFVGNGLLPGQSVRLDRPAELLVGDHARLKLVPGGGEDLHEARAAAEGAAALLDRAYAAIGVTGMEQARELKGQRDAQRSRAGELKAALKAMNPARVKARLAELRQQTEMAGSRLGLLLERVVGDARVLPGALEALHEELAAIARSLTDVRATLAKHEEKLHGTRAALDKVREGLDGEKQALELKQREISGIKGKLTQASKELADRTSREAEIASEGARVEEVAAKLEQVEKQLERLALPRLRQDLGRYLAQEKADADERVRLRDAKTRSETLLGGHGSLDARERKLLAEAEARRRAEAFRIADLDARADLLLYETLRAAQDELHEKVALPLRAGIEDYLYDLFDEKSHVEVSVRRGLALERLGRRSRGEFGFDKLSTGTRQQVAAAVRLAVVGIMATEHGGCLPVLMDDAFGASDQDRLDGVQRMLASAARQGLQIILLGCMPRDWAGLGECSRVQLPLPRGYLARFRAESRSGGRGASRGEEEGMVADGDGGEDGGGADHWEEGDEN